MINTVFITCEVHGRTPGVIVCRHLFDGESKVWCPIVGGENNYWICPECGEKYPDIPLGDLRSVCMHHAREMREAIEQSG